MKSSRFEPIYLKDAKRHIEWLYEKVKTTKESDTKILNAKKPSTFSKFINFLKRVF